MHTYEVVEFEPGRRLLTSTDSTQLLLDEAHVGTDYFDKRLALLKALGFKEKEIASEPELSLLDKALAFIGLN
jgi:hypothetical protein